MKGAAGLLLGLWLVPASSASAHLRVTSPAARHESLKQGPCGAGGDEARGSVVHTFMSGQTITVTWDEFVDHPGHYRISFDADGQDDFVDPAGFDDVSGGAAVLLDGIADRAGGGEYTQRVTLPDVECDNCTLQVIQVMSDKPPYGDGNDMYYQCADLVLSADADPYVPPPETTDEPEPPVDAAGCGCRGEPGPIGALALLLMWPRGRRSG